MRPNFYLKRSRWLLVLLVVLVFPMIAGCSINPLLKLQNVNEKAWLRSFPDGFDGFFVAADGRLLMINIYSLLGDCWELRDDRLVLWTHTERYPEPQPIAYRGRLDDERLVLLPAEGNDTLVYASVNNGEPISGVLYSPVYLKNLQALTLPINPESVYLQFNAEETSVRGFGGVNNFTGSYQRFGKTGFKSGPLASTMMAGQGMDYEMLLLSCLDHADTILSLEKLLFFYHGRELLGSFRAE